MLLLLTLLLAQAAPDPSAVPAVEAARDPEETAPLEEDPSPPDATAADRAVPDPAVPDPAAPDPAAADGPESFPGGEDDGPRSLESSIESTAGRMGERHFELVVRGRSGAVTVAAGAESLVSDRAPERRAVILGAEIAGEELSWEAELRTGPQAAGLSRLWARLAVHGESAGLALLARDESLRGARLRAAGAALDLEHSFAPQWLFALAASAWVTGLADPAARRSRDPWSAFGAATLDWAERWELALTARRTLGPASLSAGLGLAQPAQEGASAVRGALGAEGKLGPARLSLSLAVSHLSPADLWLAEAMLGVTWHTGDD